MSDKATSGSKNSKWKVLACLAVTLSALYIGYAFLTLIVAYPTESHRETYRQIQSISYDITDSKSLESNMEKLNTLSDTPESEYSDRVTLIMSVTSTVLSIIAIGLIYNYLRKKRVTADAAVATASVEAIAATVAAIANVPLAVMYLKHGPGLVMAIVMAIVTFILSFIFSYLVARIFQWRYNRKHSFVVE